MNSCTSSTPQVRCRRGFTLIEMLVVIAVIGLLISLSLPAVMMARERARSASCASHLRQFGSALAAYHEAMNVYPLVVVPGFSTHHSAHAMLLPYLGYDNAYEALDMRKIDVLSLPDGLGGPAFTDSASRTIRTVRVNIFVCPSDEVAIRESIPSANSYRFCMGPRPTGSIRTARQLGVSSPNGPFDVFVARRAGDCVDGLSRTAFVSERLVGDADPERYTPDRDMWYGEIGNLEENILDAKYYENLCPRPPTVPPPFHASNLGHSWMSDGSLNTLYNHVFTPNHPYPDCANNIHRVNLAHGPFTARSRHSGRVHVLLGDGSVHPISDAVDRVVWRAIATIDGGETLTESF